MARPRNASDDQLLSRIADTLGDADNTWTLGDAAAGAGVHAATLIKRFGSRRGLLIALSQRWINALPTEPTTDDPYQELLAWIDSWGTKSTSRGQTLTRLDMLVEDLRDPELRDLLDRGWNQNLAYLSALIDHARRDGQMTPGVCSDQFARLLLDTAHGSLLRAAVAPAGSVDPAHTTRGLLEALTSVGGHATSPASCSFSAPAPALA